MHINARDKLFNDFTCIRGQCAYKVENLRVFIFPASRENADGRIIDLSAAPWEKDLAIRTM